MDGLHTLPDVPKVSCLMVTASDPRRFALLRLSVDSYLSQSYFNRELVVVVTGEGEALAAVTGYIDMLGRPDIRIIPAAEALTLGALRNISIASANGEIVCQWDDDDLNHPRRLEVQVEALLASAGICMFFSEILLFFRSRKSLHCLNYAGTPMTAAPNTLMCWRSAGIEYPEHGPNARLAEDTVVIEQFQKMAGFQTMPGVGHLHVYVVHGANSWDIDFHHMLVDRLAISKGLLRRREASLRSDLSQIDFGGGPIAFMGGNGLAFTLDEHRTRDD